MKILCIGQSAYDITLPVTDYPKENRKVKIGNSKVECGGGASNNAAYLLGYWGSDVSLVSCIGNDIYGEKIKKELESVNVDISNFEVLDMETTTSYIIANTNMGTRTIITNKNPLMKFSDNHEINIKPDVILIDGNDYELSLKTLKKYPDAISIIDAGSVKDGSYELCKNCKYVLCSNDFAREYTKIDFDYKDIEALKRIHQKLEYEFNSTVVITLEKEGCFTKVNGEYKVIPSIKVNSVDSTGAGDIFHGAFTYFISHGYEFTKALRLSNITGALSTLKIGSKNSMPSLEEVIGYELR